MIGAKSSNPFFFRDEMMFCKKRSQQIDGLADANDDDDVITLGSHISDITCDVQYCVIHMIMMFVIILALTIQRGEGTIKEVIKCYFQSCFDSCRYAQNTPDQV